MDARHKRMGVSINSHPFYAMTVSFMAKKPLIFGEYIVENSGNVNPRISDIFICKNKKQKQNPYQYSGFRHF